MTRFTPFVALLVLLAAPVSAQEPVAAPVTAPSAEEVAEPEAVPAASAPSSAPAEAPAVPSQPAVPGVAVEAVSAPGDALDTAPADPLAPPEAPGSQPTSTSSLDRASTAGASEPTSAPDSASASMPAGPALVGKPGVAGGLEEVEDIGRVAVSLPPGTRWQVEVPTELHAVYLVLSPSPPDIKAQLLAYTAGDDLKVRIERNEPNLTVARIEQRNRRRGPLVVRPRTGLDADRALRPGMDEADVPLRGVADPNAEATPLVLHTGRLRRFATTDALCAMFRAPLPLEDRVPSPKLDLFRKAEAMFQAGDDAGAMPLFREVARTLPGHAIRGEYHARLGPENLARLRIADAALCMGKLRVARLRYEYLTDQGEYGPLRGLISLRFAELAWPEIPRDRALKLIAELEEPDAPEIVWHHTLVQAARVALLTGEQELGLELISKVPPHHRPQPLMEELLLQGIVAREAQGDDLGVASLAYDNRELLRAHPRGAALAVAAADAMRRAGAPAVSTSFLQEVLEELNSPPFLMLAVLARGYREAGDAYRAEKTIQYLVEQLRAAGGWLGRREEITISLAAAEVAIDAGGWQTAQRWLERADTVGGGPSVRALLRWSEAQVAVQAGRPEGATAPMLEAARMRRFLAPHRRAEVVLAASRNAIAHERVPDAEGLLRRFMMETQTVDEEVEVGYLLAQTFEAQGKFSLARGVYEDLGLRYSGTTFGALAAERGERLRFRERAARTMALRN